MRKCYVSAAAAMLFATMGSFGSEISAETAESTASAFLQRSAMARRILPDRTVAGSERWRSLWIVNLSPSGHIVLAGSDKCRPIISFSIDDFEDPETDSPIAASLEAHSTHCDEAEADDSLEADGGWARYAEVTTTKRQRAGASINLDTNHAAFVVGPLTGASWHQGAPYSDLTPLSCPCGCSATAGGQELYYWKWPHRMEDDFTFAHELNGAANSYTNRMNGLVPFDWERMVDSYGKDANNNDRTTFRDDDKASTYAAAHLINWVQPFVHMSFGNGGSGALRKLNASEITEKWYEAGWVQSKWYTYETGTKVDSNFAQLWTAITNDIAFGSPINVNSRGHQMVVEGYALDSDNQEFICLNYGWGGGGTWVDLENEIDNGGAGGTLADFQIGFRPKRRVQFDVVPKVSKDDIRLVWYLPHCYTNRIDGFERIVSDATQTYVYTNSVAAGNTATVYTNDVSLAGLSGEVTFTVTPIMKSGEGEGVSTVATTTIGEPHGMPGVESISAIGGGLELAQAGFYAECGMGITNTITVTCTEDTTGLRAVPTHLSVLPDERVSVVTNGHEFTVHVDATTMNSKWVGDMILLTLIASNADGTEVAKNLMLRFNSTRQVLDGTFDVVVADNSEVSDSVWFCATSNTVIDIKGKSVTFKPHAFMGTGTVTLTDSVGGGTYNFEGLDDFNGTIKWTNTTGTDWPAGYTVNLPSGYSIEYSGDERSVVRDNVTPADKAPVPVVVWDGDFDSTAKSGYNLNRSGNGGDNSTITIDQDVGVKVDFTNGISGGVTVMFKYANLTDLSHTNTLVTSYVKGHDENSTGVYLDAAGKANGLWETTKTHSTAADRKTAGSEMASGTMAFYYQKDYGTTLHYLNGTKCKRVFNCESLTSSVDGTIYGCTIGGEREKTGATLFRSARGMQITGIAIFSGKLTREQMVSYIWPSEVAILDVNADTTVSALNTRISTDAPTDTYRRAEVNLAAGATIDVDARFSVDLPVTINSGGNITLSAASMPAVSYFNNIDFSGVKGAVLRSWLMPGVVGFNFKSSKGQKTSSALVSGAWYENLDNKDGTSTELFPDGLSALIWSSSNCYGYQEGSILNGYLDDGNNGGNGVTVTLSNVPYESYDVIIYASTDTENANFTAKTVNGTTYTWNADTGSVDEGSTSWGASRQSPPQYGVNALRISNLTGPLTIYGGLRNGSTRGGIAAIQIVPALYTLTIGGDCTWSGGTWTKAGVRTDFVPISGRVEIVANAAATLTIDRDICIDDLTVTGSYSGDLVFNVLPGVTFSLRGRLVADNIRFTGGGKVVCLEGNTLQGTIKDSCVIEYPEGVLPDASAVFTDPEWTGTNVFTNCGNSNNSSHTYVDLSKLGNDNSYLKMPGFNGYLANDVTCSATLIIDEGTEFNISNGDSGHYNIFKKVAGTGMFVISGDNSASFQAVVRDVSAFEGEIKVVNVGRKSIVVGAPDDWSCDYSTYQRKIVVAGNVTIASGKTWYVTDSHGLVVLGTGTLGFAGTGEDPAISGRLDLRSNATVKLPADASFPYKLATSGTMADDGSVRFFEGNVNSTDSLVFSDGTVWKKVNVVNHINPVTGEQESYTNIFYGAVSAVWEAWRNWGTTNIPYIAGYANYNPALFDGDNLLVAGNTNVTCAAAEGWNVRWGFYNGINATIGSLNKLQGNTNFWITVDDSSKLTVNGWGGGNIVPNSGTLDMDLYVASEDGVCFNADLLSGSNDGSLTVNYHLAGEGSVSFKALEICNHAIRRADVRLSGGEKSLRSKTLVSFSSTTKAFAADAAIKVLAPAGNVFTTAALTSVNATGETSLTTDNAVGDCELVQTSNGVVLYYVDGDPYKPSININFTNGAGNGLTTGADVGLSGYEVPGTSWNNLVVANNTTYSTLNAIDSTGAASVASGVSVSISGTRGHWNCSNLTPASNPLHGYIDEEAGNPTPTVTITGIPYEHYRVIVYHSTDTENAQFGYDTINGFNFTYVNGVQTEGTTSWGSAGASNSAEPIGEGTNTLVSAVLSGDTVTMVAHRMSSSVRGCFAAIQVVEYVPEVGENDLEIAVDGDTDYAVDTAKTLSGTVYLTGSGTLTLSGSEKITAATIDVAKDVVLNINADLLDATTFTGAGTVVYDTTAPVEGKGWASIGWSGTVWIKNQSVSSFEGTKFGNAGSTVRFTGVTGFLQTSSYNSSTYVHTVPLELVDEGNTVAFTYNDGWSGYLVKVNTLKGTGTLKTQGNGLGEHIYIVDGSGFTGVFNLTGKYVYVGGSQPDNLSSTNPDGKLEIRSGVTMTVPSGKTWTASGGVVLNGGLAFAGTGSVAGSVSAASGSVLDFSGSISAKPVTGTLTIANGTTIKLPAGAAFPYTLANAITISDPCSVTLQIGERVYSSTALEVSGGAICCTGATATFAGSESAVNWGDLVWDVAYHVENPDATLTVNATGSGTIDVGTLAEETLNFSVAENQELTLTGSIEATTVALSGSGRIVLNTALDVGSLSKSGTVSVVLDTQGLESGLSAGGRVMLFSGVEASFFDDIILPASTSSLYFVLQTTSEGAYLVAIPTWADTVNINFTHSSASLTTSESVGLVGVPGTQWNNVTGIKESGNGEDTGVYQNAKVVSEDGMQSVSIPGLDVSYSGTRGSWAAITLTSSSDLRHGYLDDYDSDSTRAPRVAITGIPFEKYRVIVYHSTDTANANFGYDTVNGDNLYYDSDGVRRSGTTTWGNAGASNSAKPIEEGVNTLVSGVQTSGDLVVVTHRGGRAGLAAIQVVKVDEATIAEAGTYTLVGLFGSVSTNSQFYLNVTEDATLNIASATTIGALDINVATGKTLTITGGATLATTLGGFTVSGDVTVEIDSAMAGGLGAPRKKIVDGKIYGSLNLVVSSESDEDYFYDGNIIPSEGICLCTSPKTASFAMGIDDRVSGRYVTTSEQLAFSGITLQQFYEGGYTLKGRFAGGSIDNRGVEATGYNPVVTDDGAGNVTSIRYEMKAYNNQLKCVVITLTPNAGNTGINVVATPVTVGSNTSAALYAASSWAIGTAFLDGSSTVSGVSKGTFGTSDGAGSSYCLYYLHILGRCSKQIVLDGDAQYTVGTDLATAYESLTVSGSGRMYVSGSHLAAGAVTVKSGATLVHAGGASMGGDVAVESGGTLAVNPGSGQTINFGIGISGAGSVAVETGIVTLHRKNPSLTGGVVVNSGATLKPGYNTCFGAEDSWVTVQSGGTLDLDGQAINYNYAIAGTGVDGNGALVNNGGDIADNAPQMRSITLAGNATIGGSGNFGVIKSNWYQSKLKFPTGGATLTIDMADGKNFWMCNMIRDTSGGNGTIKVVGGNFYPRYSNLTLDGVTLKFDGGKLSGDKALAVMTLDIHSGTPCIDYNQSLTATTVNVNAGGFARTNTTSVTTMNVANGATGTVNASNQPSTNIVASGGVVMFENYNTSATIDYSSKTVSGAGTLKFQGGAFAQPVVFADATIASFTGDIVMTENGKLNLGSAGFSGKGGISATGNASITATGATMPIDITGVDGGTTLTVTGAQVDIGTNRPEGTLAFGTGAGTSTLKATFKGASEPEIVVNVSGDLTPANVTAYQPGGTVEETAVNKTIEGGVLTIALANQYPITGSYVDFADIRVVSTGTATITAEHPVTIGVTTDNVSQLTSRTGGYVNLYASGDGSFTLLFEDNVAAQLDGMKVAGDYTAMFDVGTFTQTGLDTDIAVPADTLYAFTNSTDSAAEYPSVLVVPGTGAVKTVADLEFSATNVFASGATLEVAAGTAEFNFATTGAPETITIDEGATLAISSTALTVANGISVTGSGTLKILDDLTVTGNMTIASGVTLAFADGASLTVTGDFTVSGEGSLAVAPDPTSETSVTLLTVSPGPISGTFTLSAPVDAANTYSLYRTATAVVLRRTPVAGVTYKATPGETPHGWFSSWSYDGFETALRVGPSATHPMVWEAVSSVASRNCPGSSVHSCVNGESDFTFSIYADASKMPRSGNRYVMLSVGGAAAAGKAGFLMYEKDGNVCATCFEGGTFYPAADNIGLPIVSGYHLWTMTYRKSTGKLTLYMDAGGVGNAADGTVDDAKRNVLDDVGDRGLQVGNLWTGLPFSGNWARADKMAVAQVLGYASELSAEEIANLSASYPAATGTVFYGYIENKSSDSAISASQITVYSGTASGNQYLGISGEATLGIPAGETVNVPHLRMQNISSGNATVNINGIVNVTSESTTYDVYSERHQFKGILLGHWQGAGTGTYNIGAGGEINAPDAWLQTVYGAGRQTINVDGLLKVKGIYCRNSDNSTVNLRNGGVIEIAATTDQGAIVSYNFGHGAFKADTTMTLSSANKAVITFSGTEENPTTLDPDGNVLTLDDSALTGSGDITVSDSSEAGNGRVVFGAGSSYTGRIMITDGNVANIDISAYTGKVVYSGSTANVGILDGFAGTVYFASDVDVSAIDLSGANINIADNIAVMATATKEGKSLVIGSGATLTLKVTDTMVGYDGYFPVVSGSGVVTYVKTSDGTAVSSEQIAGHNLLPYYNVWIPSEDGNGNTISADAADRWRLRSLPAEGKNVAFKLNGDATVTIDATITYNNVQVYGSGTLLFEGDGTNHMTATNLIITSGVAVTINDGDNPLYVTGGTVSGGDGITLVSGANLTLEDVACSTKVSALDGSSLTTRGMTSLSSMENTFAGNTDIFVLTGTNELTSAGIGIRGRQTVSAGATLKLMTWDALNYNVNTETYVYGNLSIADGQKISLEDSNGGNNIHLYPGATITGGGYFDSCGGIIYVECGPEGETGTARMNLTGNGDSGTTLRLDDLRTDVAEGMTFEVTSKFSGSYAINKTGDGTLRFVDVNLPRVAGSEGVLEFSANDNDIYAASAMTYSGKFVVSKGEKNKWPHFKGVAPFFNESALPDMDVTGGFVLTENYNNTNIVVRNFSGSGTVSPKYGGLADGSDTPRTLKTVQTEDTVFSGQFITSDTSSRHRNTCLTVVGADETVHALTLSGTNTTYGALTVQDYGKVVFTSTGSWANGSVTVGNNGYLESTNNAAISSLTLLGGSRLILVNAPLTVNGTLTLPTSGYVTIDPGSIDMSGESAVLISGVTPSEALVDGTMLSTVIVKDHLMIVAAKANGDKIDIVAYNELPVESESEGTDVSVPIEWAFVNALDAINAKAPSTVSALEGLLATEHGANGCTYLESYALGLSPTQKDSQPTADTALSSDGNHMEMFLKDLNVPEGVVLTVTAVKKLPGGKEEVLSEASVTVTKESPNRVVLPIPEGRVQSYRLKVGISGPVAASAGD